MTCHQLSGMLWMYGGVLRIGGLDWDRLWRDSVCAAQAWLQSYGMVMHDNLRVWYMMLQAVQEFVLYINQIKSDNHLYHWFGRRPTNFPKGDESWAWSKLTNDWWKLYTSLSANTIMAKLTNLFQRTKLITSSTDKHSSLGSEDDFRSGCWNVTHQQQFFSELPSPGQSHNTN